MQPREALFLGACLLELVVANMTFALISPFFPIYAPSVGLDLEQISLVFGAMSFAQLFASPLAGPLATRFGRRRMLGVGTALLSVAGSLFGVVPPLMDGGAAAATGEAVPWLAEVLVLLRLAQGVGCAFTTTCVFAVLADAFPDSVGKVMGAAELAGGMGWTVSPPLGGLMYAAGGFTTPFLVFGPLPVAVLLMILALMPADLPTPGGRREEARRRAALPPAWRRVWRLGTLSLAITAVLAMLPFAIWSCFDVGFTVWMVQEFGVDVLTATLFFTITPLTYMLGTVPAGYATDRWSQPGRKKLLLAIGQCVSGVLYVGFGSWWLEGASSTVQKWVIGVLLTLLGFANPLFMVPALPDMHECHDGQACEDTTNLISALYTTMMNLGGVVGPAIATVGIGQLGFRDTIAVFGVAMVALSVGVALFVLRAPPRIVRGSSADGLYSALDTTDEAAAHEAVVLEEKREEERLLAAETAAEARQTAWRLAAAEDEREHGSPCASPRSPALRPQPEPEPQASSAET